MCNRDAETTVIHVHYVPICNVLGVFSAILDSPLPVL